MLSGSRRVQLERMQLVLTMSETTIAGSLLYPFCTICCVATGHYLLHCPYLVPILPPRQALAITHNARTS